MIRGWVAYFRMSDVKAGFEELKSFSKRDDAKTTLDAMRIVQNSRTKTSLELNGALRH